MDPEGKSIAGFVKNIMRSPDGKNIDPKFVEIHDTLRAGEKDLEQRFKAEFERLQLETLLQVASVIRPDLVEEIGDAIKRL